MEKGFSCQKILQKEIQSIVQYQIEDFGAVYSVERTRVFSTACFLLSKLMKNFSGVTIQQLLRKRFVSNTDSTTLYTHTTKPTN